MIHTARECRELRRYMESREREGRLQEVMEEIHDLRRAGEITNRFSLRNLFCEVVPDGYEALQEMESRHRGGNSLVMEAGGDSITTANFSNIIGQIAYADVLGNFDGAELISRDLMTEIPATTQLPEMVPGVTMLGDAGSKIGEGEEYPLVQISEQYIILPAIFKTGFMMNITEEAIFEDKTGLLLDHFNKASEAMAVNEEKENLSTVLGVTNTYRRNGGPEQNTYGNTHTQGDFNNLIATNPLVDKVSLSASKNAFADITDPDTGEPIMLGRDLAIIVPDTLEWTLSDILSAKEYRSQPTRGGSGSGSAMMISGNPINVGGRTYTPYSSQYVASVGGSDTTWWIGNFKKAFVKRVIYGTQVQVEDRSGPLSFQRDIVSRVKVRRKTKPGVKEPRFVQKHTA